MSNNSAQSTAYGGEFQALAPTMQSYHGTSAAIAHKLATERDNVDVSIGGGELGRGFYTGEKLYLAKAWAFHVSGDKQRNVVEFVKPDRLVVPLAIELLGHGEAALKRAEIRKQNATRTYSFGVDMVWAPIVGTERISGDQYKWESAQAESLLNSSFCLRNLK